MEHGLVNSIIYVQPIKFLVNLSINNIVTRTHYCGHIWIIIVFLGSVSLSLLSNLYSLVILVSCIPRSLFDCL